MGSMIILFFNEFESNNEAFRSFFAMGAKFESNQIILNGVQWHSFPKNSFDFLNNNRLVPF